MAETRSGLNPQAKQHSTAEVIEVARRPLVVARHIQSVQTALHQIGDPLLAEITPPTEEDLGLFRHISEDTTLSSVPFHEGLIEHACLQIEDGKLPTESLVPIIAATYRHLQDRLKEHQGGHESSLEDLKTLTCGDLIKLQNEPNKLAFGTSDFFKSIVFTASQADGCQDNLRLISRADQADGSWQEAGGEPALSREEEEPLEVLPEERRKTAKIRLVQKRIRNRFYKKVFLVYFDRDTLDPAEVAAHNTILDWLNAIADTPHLFPFMQGQTQEQKRFRLRELWRKLSNSTNSTKELIAAGKPRNTSIILQIKTPKNASSNYPEMVTRLLRLIMHSPSPPRCALSNISSPGFRKIMDKDFILPPDPKSR